MDKDHLRKIATLGGKTRIRIHGNPGTPVGRRKGGLRSAQLRKRKASGFKVLRRVRTPRYSGDLAELIGVFIGDGHVGTYQASVVTNSETDLAHALHIQSLIEKVLKVPASLSYRKDCKACVVRISSRQACDVLESLGMPRGNKLEKGPAMPSWVAMNSLFQARFIRGLFDTDGTVYFDRHTVKGKEYASLCIAITSASEILCEDVFNFFSRNGYKPTRWGRNIRLRRKVDVMRYMREIGSSNPKHLKRTRV